jgi:hypothetical protein
MDPDAFGVPVGHRAEHRRLVVWHQEAEECRLSNALVDAVLPPGFGPPLPGQIEAL